MTQAVLAAALLDPQAPCPSFLRAWNGADPARRLAVHRNNVVSSLVDALADTFPVAQALLGKDFFRAAAAVFVREQPPRSPLLAYYGGGFPAFLESFAPVRDLAYLADVARLEFARVEAFHAADAEPLKASGLGDIAGSGERAGELRLVTHPSLRLVTSAHPVAAIWAAHQGIGELEDVDLGCAESVLVLRPALEVLVVPCDAGTAAFARCLQQGRTLSDSAQHAAGAAADLDLAATLSLLMAHGAITAILPPPEPCP